MTEILTRQRLNANLLDQLSRIQRQMQIMERSAAHPTDEGVLWLSGVLLKVLDAPPAPPPSGYIALYAEGSGSATYLRAMDDTGVVKTLDSWV